MDTGHDQIMRVHECWIDAEKRGDIEAMLALCADDIRIIPPDQPLVSGKEAARAFLTNPSDSILEMETSNIQIAIGGSFAIKIAAFVTKLKTGDSDSIIRGNHLWLLRNEDVWRITIVAWALL